MFVEIKNVLKNKPMNASSGHIFVSFRITQNSGCPTVSKNSLVIKNHHIEISISIVSQSGTQILILKKKNNNMRWKQTEIRNRGIKLDDEKKKKKKNSFNPIPLCFSCPEHRIPGNCCTVDIFNILDYVQFYFHPHPPFPPQITYVGSF